MRTLLALILLTSTVLAADPIEPDEETKKRALMLGYTLNGNSMVRDPSRGSIDVRELLELTKPHITTLPPKAPDALIGPVNRQDGLPKP